jgi:SAM-dependent methyltransferase
VSPFPPLTPARHRGVEILDDPAVDPRDRDRSIRDVVQSNRWLGGMRAALLALDRSFDGLRGTAILLDVGTGLADIPARARERASRRGIALTAVGVDGSETLLHAAGSRLHERVCADALRLPLRSASADVVLCSQTLHHFDHDRAIALIRELDRVARHRVVISDLRRNWIAVAGFKAAASALRFHEITRHDGVVSILRGFTARELGTMIFEATGADAEVHHRLGFRLTASWRPAQARQETT